jgi:hypothetical protein
MIKKLQTMTILNMQIMKNSKHAKHDNSKQWHMAATVSLFELGP